MTLYHERSNRKLRAKRFRPFAIVELIGPNAVRLKVPENVRIHPVVHVVHTTQHFTQPADVSQPVAPRPAPVPSSTGPQYVVDTILSHRKRGRRYQWLTLMEGAPQHEAQWQPTPDFLDADGTLTTAFHAYIARQNLLPHRH